MHSHATVIGNNTRKSPRLYVGLSLICFIYYHQKLLAYSICGKDLSCNITGEANITVK